MKLSEMFIGQIVRIKRENFKIGYVVGLEINIEETIPTIKFSDEEQPRGVHHGNLCKYED